MAETGGDPFESWVAALEARHRERLTFPEIRRALTALSSLYVERRERLASGAALDGAGKRAAFALYYGPLHFLLVREIVRATGAATPAPARLLDLGCGTGVAGAAWAREAGGTPVVDAVDRSAWAVDEARWTLGRLRVAGTARRGDLATASLPPPGGAVVAAFALNEVADPERDRLRERLAEAAGRGTAVLVVEPLARRGRPWWPAWSEALRARGGREDEWRFAVPLPPVVSLLGKAAGLDPRAVSGRSLYCPPAPAPAR